MGKLIITDFWGTTAIVVAAKRAVRTERVAKRIARVDRVFVRVWELDVYQVRWFGDGGV